MPMPSHFYLGVREPQQQRLAALSQPLPLSFALWASAAGLARDLQLELLPQTKSLDKASHTLPVLLFDPQRPHVKPVLIVLAPQGLWCSCPDCQTKTEEGDCRGK